MCSDGRTAGSARTRLDRNWCGGTPTGVAEYQRLGGCPACSDDTPWAATEFGDLKVPEMTTSTTKSRRLRGRTRKTFVVVHIVSGAAWFGIDLALGILVVTALVTSDPHTAGMAAQAVELFAIWPMFIASLLCL